MARITVEDCLKKVNNRFALIHMASKRVRQLRKGAEPLITSKNRDIVISLREIAAGKVANSNTGDSSGPKEERSDLLTEETESENDENKSKGEEESQGS